jgi:hypothetical protein
MRYKYIIIREKPYNTGQTMAQVNVSHLNKKGIEAIRFDLETKFSPEEYCSCLIECNHQMHEF